jgi:hypothetical protein
MEALPFYIPLVFMITTILACAFFYAAAPNKKIVLIVIVSLLLIQAVLGISYFFLVTDGLPPRFVFIVLPPIVLLIVLFTTAGGRAFIDGMNLKYLILLQVVRLPVEIVLYWLFLNKAMPELMTFEGRNFDIFTGLTAPIVFYLYFVQKKITHKLLLAWNLVCLVILLFTITNGILSAPTPFQLFAFDQPNIAVLYFPFVWLPGVVVPLAYYSHFMSIRKLMSKIKTEQDLVLANFNK